jgi:8-oxo-dGTP diphosphatase
MRQPARELEEETGLEVAPADLRLAHLLHCHAGEGGAEWLGAFFVAERWTGEPRLMEPDKHDAIGWFALDALPARTIAYTRQGIAACARAIPFSTFGWPPPGRRLSRWRGRRSGRRRRRW